MSRLFQDFSFIGLFTRAFISFIFALGFGFYVALSFRFVLDFSNRDAGFLGFGSGVAMFIFSGFVFYYLDSDL